MSSSALADGLRHLRDKLAAQARGEESDEHLLHAFLNRRDEDAFAVLARRHGPMVLQVCRRVLGHEQDAEDAFQAVFLVLARRAAKLRKKTSLASWLYGVAHRTALKAKQTAARRRKYEGSLRALTQSRSPANPAEEISWREVRALLDEEIARLPEIYRSVFIHCCLEELSRAEAARRLGINENTLSSRLAKARERLAQRMTRRGVNLTATLAVSTLEASSAPALSPALISATVKAAMATALDGGMASLVSAALLSKTKSVLAMLLAVSVLAGAGVWWSRDFILLSGERKPPEMSTTRGPNAPRSAKHEPAATVTVRGHVIDPDGKPVRGAKLVLAFHRIKKNIANKIWATSSAEGRFQFTIPRMAEDESLWHTPDDLPYVLAAAKGFGLAAAPLDNPETAANLTLRLVKDDVPLRGRVLDLQGKPIAGVRVRISDFALYAGRNKLYLPKQGDLTAWLAALKTRNRGPQDLERAYLTAVCSPFFGSLFPPVTTGADGRFEIRGIGRERVADLFLEGPTIATQLIAVMTRSHETIRQPWDRANPKGQIAVYHGNGDDILAEPTKPVEGVVRDRDTSKPLAGVKIVTNKIANPWNIFNYKYGLLHTITDKDGRYRLIGLPKGEDNQLLATTEDLPYLSWSKKVENTPGLGTVAVDFALKRGIWVKGRIAEKGTGKPLDGGIGYYCFRDNPHMKEIVHVIGATDSAIRKDGFFQLVAAPGHGLIVLGLGGYYLDGASAVKIKGPRFEIAGIEAFDTVPYWIAIDRSMVEINPKPGEDSIRLDLLAVPYRTLKGMVLGPDGKPLTGARRVGWETLPGSEFKVKVLPPNKLREPRVIEFVHEGKKLAGFVTVHGDEKKPLKVRLQPWGVLTGQVVTPQGEPLTGVRVSCHAGDDLPDKQGRFRIERLTPGRKYELWVSKEGRALHIIDGDLKNLAVKPGETKNLGVLKVKAME